MRIAARPTPRPVPHPVHNHRPAPRRVNGTQAPPGTVQSTIGSGHIGISAGYQQRVSSAADQILAAARLFPLHPSDSLARIVDATRSLFETMQLDRLATALSAVAGQAGTELPKTLAAAEQQLGSMIPFLPAAQRITAAAMKSRLGRFRQEAARRLEGPVTELRALAARLNALDQAGRRATRPDDMETIAREIRQTTEQASRVMGELRELSEWAKGETAGLREALESSSLSYLQPVRTMIGDLGRAERAMAALPGRIDPLRTQADEGARQLRKIEPILGIAIDAAKAHARALDSSLEHLSTGLEHWAAGRRSEAIRDFAKIGATAPLAAISWGLGMGGVFTEHLGQSLLGKSPLWAPIALPLIVLAGFQHAGAGVAAFINDNLINPVGTLMADATHALVRPFLAPLRSIGGVAYDAGKSAVGAIKAGANAVVEGGKHIAGAIVDGGKAVANGAKNLAKKTWSGLKSWSPF